jgi:NOL1/NOP2/fmu family ribosome biogenesis protein
MALRADDFKQTVNYPADGQEIASFLRGESLSASPQLKGWTGVLVDGFPLGWGKASDGVLKNHYPKGLRIP